MAVGSYRQRHPSPAGPSLPDGPQTDHPATQLPACPTPEVAASDLGDVPWIYLGDESVIGWRLGSAGPRRTTKEGLS
jgi:hypothetical protein